MNNPGRDYSGMSADVLFRTGMGNWSACFFSKDELIQTASRWKQSFEGIDYPWLCWNVDPDWCVLQQRLILSVGWTPVVGYDPRCGAPPLENGAVLVDFNEEFALPTMYPHFPLEFAFAFCNRIAFWHSDLLVRLPVLRKIANEFRQIADGKMAAVPGRGGIKKLLRPWAHRYWELIGCTTKGASLNQYELGAGWWYNFCAHPNFKGSPKLFGRPYYWDHGTGIMYWARRRPGHIHQIPERLVEEGHFTSIGAKKYVRESPNNHRRNLSLDLRKNFDLAACAAKLELNEFL
jgi:hypothetical protein